VEPSIRFDGYRLALGRGSQVHQYRPDCGSNSSGRTGTAEGCKGAEGCEACGCRSRSCHSYACHSYAYISGNAEACCLENTEGASDGPFLFILKLEPSFMTAIMVIDTETSDLEIEKGAGLLELAWIKLTNETGSFEPAVSAEDYIEFAGIMSPHARAVHHIKPEQCFLSNGASTRLDAMDKLLRHVTPDTFFCAHNYEFDSKFLPEIRGPWICTMRVAKHIWPEAPSFSNQVLRYWLGIEPAIENTMGRYPHQALYDVAVTTAILQKMLTVHSVQELVNMTKRPVTLRKMTFGKHRGTPFSQIPRDYLQWLRGKTDLDPDLRHTLDSMLQP
jgi:exodeoxyribonuclease X